MACIPLCLWTKNHLVVYEFETRLKPIDKVAKSWYKFWITTTTTSSTATTRTRKTTRTRTTRRTSNNNNNRNFDTQHLTETVTWARVAISQSINQSINSKQNSLEQLLNWVASCHSELSVTKASLCCRIVWWKAWSYSTRSAITSGSLTRRLYCFWTRKICSRKRLRNRRSLSAFLSTRVRWNRLFLSSTLDIAIIVLLH